MPRSRRTKLIHSDVELPEGYRSLVTPVYRGSTTVFASAGKLRDDWRQHEVGWVYGLYGTPTALELAGRIAELEGGFRTFLVPGGQSALAVINLAFLRAGEHVLIPDSIYSPHRQLADDLLQRFGVSCDFYSPTIGAGIEAMMREQTRLVWCESPGSITMEVQDVPAIAKVAQRRAERAARRQRVGVAAAEGTRQRGPAHRPGEPRSRLGKAQLGQGAKRIGWTVHRADDLHRAAGIARQSGPYRRLALP
jgi:cystathionine beta-lyase/cystathionine gamma-synthase